MTLAELKLAVALVAVVGAATVGAYGMRKVDNGRYAMLEASYAKAQGAAVEQAQQQQKRLDDIGRHAAEQETIEQQKLVEALQDQLVEVQSHVKTISCPGATYGFVRVLVAEIRGVAANSLPIPAGKSDGACSPTSPARLASDLIRLIYTAKANAAQLNALEDAIRP